MVCVICNNPLEDQDTVIVRKKGLATLIKFSHMRKDGLFNIFGSVEDIFLHTRCRKKYIKESAKLKYNSMELYICDGNEDTDDPNGCSETDFSFKDKCFICARELSDEIMKKQSKRRICYRITSEHTKQTLVAALKNNLESFSSQKILQRIENVQLECVQARYHKDCYSSVLFFKRYLKRGRPECHDVVSAMQIIFNFMEQNKNTQFSIKELRNILTEYVPDERTIIKKLCEKFGDRIHITNLPREGPLITFKDSIDDILINNWNLQKDIIQEEKLRIVKKAAEIIRKDILIKTYDKTSTNDSLKNAKEDVPQSLEVFSKTLVGPRTTTESIERKLLSIAHAIEMVGPKKSVKN